MNDRTVVIPLKGIVRNTPGAIGSDGEMEELVNLRYRDGAFRPVGELEEYADVTGYTSIYVHSNAGYKHLLGVQNLNVYWIGTDTEGVYALKTNRALICAVNSAPTFTQIGNAVNILDSSGLKYAVWYNSGYVLVDTHFEGGAEDEETFGRAELRVTGIMNSVNQERDVRFYYSESRFSVVSGVFLNAGGLWAKAIATEEKDGRLLDFFLARTAVELYDGSYILHSAPVLCGQAWDANTRYEAMDLPGVATPFNYNSRNKPTFFMDYTTGVVANSSDGYISKGANAFPAGYDWAVTNLNNLKEYPNLSVLWRHNEGDSATQLYAPISANKLQFKLKTSIPSRYSPLIKSISVFITPPVSMYDITKLDDTYQWAKVGSDGLFSTYPKLKTNEEIAKEIENQTVFYKVHEIPFEDLSSDSTTPVLLDTWIDIDLKDKLGNALLSLETLPVDSFSHHQLVPKGQFVYNSKLHALDYATVLYPGFPLANFFSESGVGQFSSEYGTFTGLAYWIEVTLKTANGLSKVVRYKDRSVIAITPQSLIASFLSYPDSRAVKMVIHIECYAPQTGYDWLSRELEFKLTAHTTQNFAYYLAPDLKPQTYALGVDSNQPPFNHPGELERTQAFTNAFKASEINNPFFFPAATTYQVGNGAIEALASNAVALSTGQFGEYPLLVFCSDGIEAMYLGGGQITYTTSRPVSKEVCNNKAVKPLDLGVAFSTSRGLMIISGQQVQEISIPVEGDVFDFATTGLSGYIEMVNKAVDHNLLVQLKTALEPLEFKGYLQGAILAYNYSERELWVINPAKPYSYTFGRNSVWAKVNQTCQSIVEDYPRTFMHRDGKLFDMAKEKNTASHTMFLSRPIKLGTQGFKQSYRAVLRGTINLAPDKYAGLYVFGSIDGQAWEYLGGTEKQGPLQDIGTNIERADCKYFRIAFVGQLLPNSSLDFIEFTAKGKLSDKSR